MLPLHVFHHIPKCAGNSLKIGLAIYFRLVDDYRGRSVANTAMWEAPDSFLARALDLSELSDRDLLVGHFDMPGARLWERYPGAPGREMRPISFLRDPLERAISEFCFARSGGPMELRGETLQAHLEATANPVAQWIAEDLATAPDVLERYWFVGTVEHAQRDLDSLLAVFGRTTSPLLRVNATARPPIQLGADLVDRFLDRNRIDAALYRQALDRSAAAAPFRTDLDSESGAL